MKKIRRLFRFILIAAIATAAVLGYLGYKEYRAAVMALPFSEAAEQIRSIPDYTTISEVPRMYIYAVVATEDRRFFSHKGIDPMGIIRAVTTDIKEKKLAEGGSTITQQLMKNIYFPKNNSPVRKAAEMIAAVSFEKEFSKDEIFELYMNGIYFGSGYYCIYDAAKGYFGKAPHDMTDYEATLLAGIPNAPSLYSPKVDPELCEKRRQKVLRCLVAAGYISKETAEEITPE